MHKMTKKVKEKWVSGLSDCCDSPVKEIGSGITILTCSECGNMCNVTSELDDDDEFPDDFDIIDED
jgi:hypothetical protein